MHMMKIKRRKNDETLLKLLKSKGWQWQENTGHDENDNYEENDKHRDIDEHGQENGN